MPRQSFTHPGTTFKFKVPFTGPVTFVLKGAGGAGAERSSSVATDTFSAGTSGTYTWPAGTASADVECWGGGGGGQTGGSISQGRGGSGGGGYTIKTYTAPTGSVSYSAGGGGGANTAGGDTSFDSLSAGGGQVGSNTVGGAGGTASGGDTNTNGASGGNASGGNGGGGGGGANGGAGGDGGVAGVSDATAGSFQGGGGGGGAIVGSPGDAAGAGANGFIKITRHYGDGGGGGGGGAGAVLTVNPATADHEYTLEIPAAGVVGGSDPSDCRVLDGASVIAKAKSGHNATSKTGAAGGLASGCIGDTATNGGNGGNSDTAKAGGGGGGSGGDAAAGSNGSAGGSTTGGAGGAGGSTDGGAGGKGGDMGGVAVVGSKPGGGGGGAPADTTSAAKDGADGRIDVDWFKPSDWYDTGCFCCEVGLPDTFDLVTSTASLPAGPVGSPPPCGASTFTFAQAGGWTRKINETVWDGGAVGVGNSFVQPVSWKSVKIGPIGGVTCGGYVTIWIWCNRDGEHPYGSAPLTTGYNAPGTWYCMVEYESPLLGYTMPNAPPFGGRNTTLGLFDEAFEWPCDFQCDVSVSPPDGSFVVTFAQSGDINRLIGNVWRVFGVVPLLNGGKCATHVP